MHYFPKAFYLQLMGLKKLKEKHIQFAQMLLQGYTPKEAALSIGCPPRTARSQGSKLKNDPLIVEYMEKHPYDKNSSLVLHRQREEEKQKEKAERQKQNQRIKEVRAAAQDSKLFEKYDVTKERVIREAYIIATNDPASILDENGQILPLQDIPREARHAISSIKVRVGRDKHGNDIQETEVRFYDKARYIDIVDRNTEKKKAEIRKRTPEELDAEIKKLLDKANGYSQ